MCQENIRPKNALHGSQGTHAVSEKKAEGESREGARNLTPAQATRSCLLQNHFFFLRGRSRKSEAARPADTENRLFSFSYQIASSHHVDTHKSRRKPNVSSRLYKNQKIVKL